jgi:hypothetical protein
MTDGKDATNLVNAADAAVAALSWWFAMVSGLDR